MIPVAVPTIVSNDSLMRMFVMHAKVDLSKVAAAVVPVAIVMAAVNDFVLSMMLISMLVTPTAISLIPI